MYINKEIYTYPEPRTRNPEARWPDTQQHSRQQSEQLFGLLSQAAGMQRENTRKKEVPWSYLPGSQVPGNINPNNSSGHPEDQGDPEPKYDMCLGSPQPARHNPNKFSGSRPRRWAFPYWTEKKTGLAGG